MLRPSGPFGARIDVPAVDAKPSETFHYPPNEKSIPRTSPPITTIDESELRIPLVDELSVGFEFLTLAPFMHVGIDSICMWNRLGMGLEFYSRLVELPFDGVYGGKGVLCVGYADPSLSSLRRIFLPADFLGPIKATVLSIVEQGLTFESGLILQGNNGSRMTLISGEFPYTIEIKTSFDEDVAQLSSRPGGPFQAEHYLKDYSRKSLSSKKR